MAKRGRGRPRKLRPTASKESYAYAKQISKEYIEMKALVNVVERRMNTLALMVKKKSIRGYPIPLGVDEDLAECVLDENNRKMVALYLEAKEKTFIVETGISQMEDGLWKEVARDQILVGLKPGQIRRERGISDSCRDRAIHAAITHIASQYDLVSRWKKWIKGRKSESNGGNTAGHGLEDTADSIDKAMQASNDVDNAPN